MNRQFRIIKKQKEMIDDYRQKEKHKLDQSNECIIRLQNDNGNRIGMKVFRIISDNQDMY